MKLDSPLGNLFSKKPDYRTFSVDGSLPMSDKYIGIEIEAENITMGHDALRNALSYWTVVNDGSLRNLGAEFVSLKLRGADIHRALLELMETFSANGIVPEYSDRTSVHIHADSRGLSLLQLRTLILYYLALEPYIMQYIGHSREDNNYCVPYYKNPRGLGNLGCLFLEDITDSDAVTSIRSGVKYEAMNIRSINEKGSIEFRHHYGTHSPEIILPWIRVILTLFSLSKMSSEEDFFSTFCSRPYQYFVGLISQYFPITPEADLNLCEKIANNSISILKAHAVRGRSLNQEMAAHRPRSTRS